MRIAPLVSFLVPAYNHAAYLEQCLDGIAAEPYPSKELVILDDGSTDATAQVIETWISRNGGRLPVRFRSRPNRGLTPTLNELVADARGVYLRLCASDDYCVPGSLGALVEILEQRPEKSVAFGDAAIIDQRSQQVRTSAIFGHFRGRKTNYFSDDGLKDEIVFRWSLPGPVALIRRTLYEEIGAYDERLKVEDWDFYLRAAARNRLAFVDRIVAHYRIHVSNSFSTLKARDPLASARDHLLVLERTHGLFHGRWRRELDYRLLKQRALVGDLEKGRTRSGFAKLALQIGCRWQALRQEVP